MSYVINKTYNNGYLCQCCRRTYDVESEWIHDRQKALDQFSTTVTDLAGNDLERMTITDGSTGEVIAEGEFDQMGRGKFTRWFGHKDGVPFDHINGPKGMMEGPWETAWERGGGK